MSCKITKTKQHACFSHCRLFCTFWNAVPLTFDLLCHVHVGVWLCRTHFFHASFRVFCRWWTDTKRRWQTCRWPNDRYMYFCFFGGGVGELSVNFFLKRHPKLCPYEDVASPKSWWIRNRLASCGPLPAEFPHLFCGFLFLKSKRTFFQQASICAEFEKRKISLPEKNPTTFIYLKIEWSSK